MRPMYYLLSEDGKTATPTNDPHAFSKSRTNPKWKVDSTVIGDYRVSTVFLCMAHAYDGDPLLWETMIFCDDPDLDNWQDRYSTYDEAVAGHAAAVTLVQSKSAK